MLTKEKLTEIFEQVADTMPQAGKDVTEANEIINRALDGYCSALTFETFLWAYALGYEHGKAVRGHDEY